MIYLYSGTPGSGKSLHIASKMYYWVKGGRGIVTNFDFAYSNISSRRHAPVLCLDNSSLTPEVLKAFSQEYFKRYKFREGAIKLIVDEAQLMFNSRDWDKPDRKEWISFFTQHRKYGFDVYLVAQFDNMLDKQIRSLIEYQVIHRKVGNFGKFGFLFNLLAGGRLHIAVTVWYPMKVKTYHEFFHARKKYYSLYDTLNLFNTEESSDGKKVISCESC